MLRPPEPYSEKLRRFAVVDTGDLDLVRDVVMRVFGARHFDAHGRETACRSFASQVRLANLDLGYAHFSAAVRADFPPGDLFRQQFVLHGCGQTRCGSRQFPVNHTQTCVVAPGEETGTEFTANYAQLVLRIDASALQNKLSAIVGRRVGRKIEFQGPSNLRDPRLLWLQRMIGFFADELDGGQSMPEQAVAEFEQLVMVAFLTANAHNHSRLLAGEAPDAAPWQVRAAEEFIEANWHLPIYIEDIVQTTGASGRSIFQAFRQARGYSPMEFVKRVRLNQARRLLQIPDEATSVTGVAFRCGFKNLGNFARDYRQAFGELPSVTLASRGELRGG
jgi:AraC-like DNA-binding protein